MHRGRIREWRAVPSFLRGAGPGAICRYRALHPAGQNELDASARRLLTKQLRSVIKRRPMPSTLEAVDPLFLEADILYARRA